MARVRFQTQRSQEIPLPTVPRQERQTEPIQMPTLPMLTPPMLTPPALPTDFHQAVSAAQRYSRSMQNTYGPIPRNIPPEYLRKLTPGHSAKPDSSGSKTIVTSVCVILIIIIGSWAGGQFVSSTLAPVVPATGYSVLSPPSISAGMINQVLDHYHSPAAGKGQALYDLGVKYGIDPAFPLAFFMNESTFGTQGMAVSTLALGNERCLSDRPCVNTAGLPCQTGQSCYAQFYNWPDGFEHWYMLIKNEYVSGHINQIIGRKACPCSTVAQIIPVYAPGSDSNDENHYIAVVEHAVDIWRAGKVVVA